MIIKNCIKCPNLVKSRIQIVNGQGHKNAKIFFCGIMPGNHLLHGGADSTGIVFKGDKSGEIFEQLLKDLHINRNQIYVTNLVKCRGATDDNKLYNRLPTQKEIMNCLPYLLQEINIIKPSVIICFGRLVYNTLISYFIDYKINMPIKFLYHPAYIARCPWKYKFWMESIQLIVRMQEYE